jgi:hypothetical protein
MKKPFTVLTRTGPTQTERFAEAAALAGWRAVNVAQPLPPEINPADADLFSLLGVRLVRASSMEAIA